MSTVLLLIFTAFLPFFNFYLNLDTFSISALSLREVCIQISFFAILGAKNSRSFHSSIIQFVLRMGIKNTVKYLRTRQSNPETTKGYWRSQGSSKYFLVSRILIFFIGVTSGYIRSHLYFWAPSVTTTSKMIVTVTH